MFYMEHVTEFEVQSALFSGLLNIGLKVRGEVQVDPSSGRGRKGKGIIDVMLFNDEWWPICAFEVKRHDDDWCLAEDQGLRYMRLFAERGAPCLAVSIAGLRDVADNLEAIKIGGLGLYLAKKRDQWLGSVYIDSGIGPLLARSICPELDSKLRPVRPAIRVDELRAAFAIYDQDPLARLYEAHRVS